MKKLLLFFLSIFVYDAPAQQSISAHSQAINQVVFSHDGQLLFTCSKDKTAKIWNASKQQFITTLKAYSGEIIAGAFSPNGQLVATSLSDKNIKVWNVNSGELLATFGKDPNGGFFSSDLLYTKLSFSSNTELVALGNYVLNKKYQINTWDARKGVKLKTITSNEFFVDMALFADGKSVLTQSSNYGSTSSISIYDLATSQQKKVVATGMDDKQIALSPDNKTVAMAGRDRKLTLLDISSGISIFEVATGYDPVVDLVFSPDGKIIFTASGSSLTLWDAQAGSKIKSINQSAAINTLAASSTQLALGLANGKAILYDDLFEQNSAPVQQKNLASSKGKMAFKNLVSEPMITIERGIHQARVPAVKYSNDGKQIITASWDKTIRIWDAKDWSLQRFIRVPAWKGSEGQIFTMDVSSDNRYLIAAGYSLGIRNEVKTSDYIGDYIMLIDYQTGELLDVQGAHKQTIQSVAFSADGSYAVSGGGEVDSRLVLFKVDKYKGKLIKIAEKNLAENSKNYYPSCDDRGFFGGLCSDRILGVGFVPNTNEVLSIDIMGMLMKHSKDLSASKLIGESLNRKTAGALGKIKNNAMFRILATDPKGRYVAAGDNSGLVTLFDTKNTSATELTKGKSYEKALINIPSFGTHLMAMTASPDGSKLAIATDNKIHIYDISIGTTKKTINTPSLTIYKHKEDVMGLAFSPDGSKLVSSGMNPQECFVWNVATGEKLFQLGQGAKFEILSAIGTNTRKPNEIAFGRGLNASVQINNFGRVSKAFDLAKLEVKKVKSPYAYKGAKSTARGVTPPNFKSPLQDEIRTFLPLGNGHTVIGSSYGLYLDNFASPISVDGLSTYGLAFTPDKKRFITGLENGLMRIFNTEDASQVASLYVNENEDWVLWTPDGYYTASLKGAQSVAWHSNLGAKKNPGYYPFEQFDLILNRPDLVLEQLGDADPNFIKALNKAYLKRLKKIGLKEDELQAEFELPKIKVDYISQEVSTSNISIPISASDNNSLRRLLVYANDVPVFGQSGKAVLGKTYDSSIDIALTPGKNKIQISVLNSAGIESITETRFVSYNAPKVKGNLYLIAIGVSDYQDDNFDLSYAAKDAQDLAATLASHADQYDAFTPIVITDTKATKPEILKVKQTLMNTSVNDQVILFVAGHGLFDDEYNYYFATHNMDFYNPASKGLLYEDLEDLLDGIPARKKLMLIDACHSGEIDEDEITVTTAASNTNASVKTRGFKNVTAKKIGLAKSIDLMNKYFNDLRRGTGAMVISSASGVEFAFESDLWKNGVFTYALLQGLKSGNCDSNKDGSVQISELRNYVFDKVEKLTNGKQHPTSRRENLEFDFVVW